MVVHKSGYGFTVQNIKSNVRFLESSSTPDRWFALHIRDVQTGVLLAPLRARPAHVVPPGIVGPDFPTLR
jgi:hypothetical protein